MTTYSVVTSDFVNVRITSTASGMTSEKRFQKDLTIGTFKGRLEMITGASAGNMTLELLDADDKSVCTMTDNDALLGSFPVEDNYRIHVVDSGVKRGEFEDVSKVEKFELTQDEYANRDDSLRSFLQRNKLGKYNAEEMAVLDAEKKKADEEEEAKVKDMTIGARCQVQTPGEPTRRGTVMFVGNTKFKPGMWVGLKYDEPLGKNDGSLGGVRYFDVPMKYGGFTRPMNVTVGDFPEIDLEDEM